MEMGKLIITRGNTSQATEPEFVNDRISYK